MNVDEIESFDPNAIIQAAEEKKRQHDLNGAQMMFQSALLNWVDAAREGGVRDADQAREAIATLWLAYAHFNQANNMVRISALSVVKACVIVKHTFSHL